MPRILSDVRDESKRLMGIKLRQMKKDNPELLWKFLNSLSPDEAEEILCDGEIWARESQHIDLSSKVPIHLICAGRALAKSTPILTANKGWTTIGEINVGDIVFGHDGKPTNVTEIHDEENPEKCYEVCFDTGESFVVDARHKWTTWAHRDRKKYFRNDTLNFVGRKEYDQDWPFWEEKHYIKSEKPFSPKVRTTQEIFETLNCSDRGDKNHSIPLAMPVEMDYKEVPIDPYVLGLWLGDGTRGGGHFTSADPEIVDEIRKRGFDVSCSEKVKNSYRILGLSVKLRELGIMTDKRVPEIYLNNSIDVRLELLRGLMDTDGSVLGTGCPRVEFCQAGKNLHIAEDVISLVASLGEKVTWSKSDAVLNGVKTSDRIRVGWFPNNFNPFRLSRKAEIVEKGLLNERTRTVKMKHRMITSVKEVSCPEEGLRCLTIDNKSRLFLVGKTFVPTHNSYGKTFAAAYTIKRAVEKHGITEILVIAVAARDFRATVAPAVLAQYPSKHPNRPEWITSKASIVWPNGAVAICIPSEAGEDAVRGLNNELVVFDEVAHYGRNEGIIDQAMLTLRLEPSIAIAITTPKATPKLIEWVQRAERGDDGIKLYKGSTYDNIENLSRAFTDTIISKYEGTNLGRQELDGELILTNDSALWNYDTIKRNTVGKDDVPRIVEIAIGVDPAVNKKSSQGGRSPDDTGITVVGMGEDGNLYALEGHTGSYSVEAWVQKVCALHDMYHPAYKVSIICEINVLGEQLTTMAFRQFNRHDVAAKIEPVFATQSKLQRAMPYSLLAQQDRIKYVKGEYLELLARELTTYDGTGKSPNAFDSFVWACSALKPPVKRIAKTKEFFL